METGRGAARRQLPQNAWGKKETAVNLPFYNTGDTPSFPSPSVSLNLAFSHRPCSPPHPTPALGESRARPRLFVTLPPEELQLRAGERRLFRGLPKTTEPTGSTATAQLRPGRQRTSEGLSCGFAKGARREQEGRKERPAPQTITRSAVSAGTASYQHPPHHPYPHLHLICIHTTSQIHIHTPSTSP